MILPIEQCREVWIFAKDFLWRKFPSIMLVAVSRILVNAEFMRSARDLTFTISTAQDRMDGLWIGCAVTAWSDVFLPMFPESGQVSMLFCTSPYVAKIASGTE